MFPFHSSKGVLGLNARNLLYIKPYNPRKAVALADDKLRTKAFLAARGIPVAKIYARIESREQLRNFDFSSLPDECVLKPNEGFGGEGIIILKRKKNGSTTLTTGGQFFEQGKKPISDERLREHIEDILDGRFSVTGHEDTAFFEKILVSHRGLAPFRPAGLPDVRIIVFNLVPVMAMLRIPTAESGGKANVHQGGIGIGIDIAKGVTTHATQYNKLITELPHGGSPSGIEIPHWEELLLAASRIQYVTNIGYLAVDLTLDEEQGPVLLEVNARAGLMVQVANLAPLRARLERVQGIRVDSPEKGVRIAQDLFGQKPKNYDQHAAVGEGKPVLGSKEVISLSGGNATIEAAAFISLEEERTTFAPSLLRELDRMGAIDESDKTEEGFRVKFSLGGRKIQTVVYEGDVASGMRAIIGRRDLAGFLIDPSKETDVSPRAAVKADLRAIDKTLSQLDHDLMLLKHLKPHNLHEERERALQDRRYNPVFQYEPLPIDLEDIETKLLALAPDGSPLGLLCRKKKRELLQRISALRVRGDSRMLTENVIALYGQPTSVLLAAAQSFLKSRIASDLPPQGDDVMTSEEAAELFADSLQKYGLHNWQVKVRDNVIARVSVGGESVYIRKDATFSRRHIAGLIAHEIETHVITAENGEHQPYDLFRRGFANYMDTQEGLAIYNQNRFLSPHHEKRYGPARNILGTAYALEHSFAETRDYLEYTLGYDSDKALTKAIDMKRGMSDTSEPGGFTKGIVYFRGLRAIEQFLSEGGDLKKLYVGKVALEDLELIEQIAGIKAPLILPTFLRPEVKGDKKVTRKKKAK